jgi:hypothetical protein
MPTTYEPISTQTLGTATATVTFSSIPATYTDLVLVFNGSVTSGNPSIIGRFNSDTGTNYSYTRMFGNGSTAGSARGSSTTSLGLSTAAGATTTFETTLICHVFNYANSTTNKTCIARNNVASTGVEASVSLWRNTSAITSFSVIADGTNFSVGCTFTLYGIKAA